MNKIISILGIQTELIPLQRNKLKGLNADLLLRFIYYTTVFGKRFWDFIVSGGYKTRQRKSDDKTSKAELFRFFHPKDGFPVQIELLSKHPDVLGEPTGFHLTPIPIGDSISSLSAILMWILEDIWTL